MFNPRKCKRDLEYANNRDINATRPCAVTCKFARSLQFECSKLTFNFLVSLISSGATAALYRANLYFILFASMNQWCIFFNVSFRTASIIESLRYWADWQCLPDLCTVNSRRSFSWTKSNLGSAVQLFHSCRTNRAAHQLYLILFATARKLRRIQILFVSGLNIDYSWVVFVRVLCLHRPFNPIQNNPGFCYLSCGITFPPLL